MKLRLVGLLAVAGLATGLGGVSVIGQSRADPVEVRVAAARAAARQEYTRLFNSVCDPTFVIPAAPTQGVPDRSQWYAEPVKVFDNLYVLGQSESSWPGAPAAWAVTTSEGIILIDTLFDYSVEDEIVGGLKKLGLDPTTIKYAVVSHGHFDHSGGAKYLQDQFGTRVILSAADWDWLDGNPAAQAKPARDIVASDGQKLSLGDTTLTLYVTPGHTPGTISTIIPLRDGGRLHTAALWGGTGFNWIANSAIRARYITPDRADGFWFETYSNSARRFRDIAVKAGAEFSTKIQMCRALGIRPVFAVRMLPKSWIHELISGGGFALILKHQLYPWAHRDLARRVKMELGLPVDAPRALEGGTMARFLRWHQGL